MSTPNEMSFDFAQGALKFSLIRTGHLYSQHISDVDGKELVKILYNGERVSSSSKDGLPGHLSTDQKSEFISESALMTNDLMNAPATDGGNVEGIQGTRIIHVKIKNGAPIDLWVDSETSEIKCSFLRLSNRTVVFRPIATGELRGGRKYVGIWQRDHEERIIVTSVSTST